MSHLVATQQTDWALRLAVALYRYWDHREYLSEGRAWFEAVLDLAGAERRKAGRARALNYAAALAEHQGEHRVAHTRQREALAIYRDIGDRRGEIMVLNALAAVICACVRMSFSSGEK